MRRSVLVTGGARRLGATMCRAFADRGWHVVIHCNSSRQEAEALAADLPDAEIVQADLSDPQAGAGLVRDLAARLADWRCLVNSASVFQPDTVTAIDPATNHRAMQVNALSPAIMAQTYLAHARSEGRRHVVQVTDQKLANLNPDFFSYTMSKAAADIAARMMAMAARHGDKVYTLAPGAILPSHDQSAAEAERSHRRNLLRRRTEPSEVADAAVFLAEGTLASGETIWVDSGQHLLNQPRDVIYLEREGEEG